MRVRITEEDNLGWRKTMTFEEKAIDEKMTKTLIERCLTSKLYSVSNNKKQP
jgi:hypothetical protein